jgi:hypothetical protein
LPLQRNLPSPTPAGCELLHNSASFLIAWERDSAWGDAAMAVSLFSDGSTGGTAARRRKNYARYREVCQYLFSRRLPRELTARASCFDDEWFPVERLPRRRPAKGTPAHVAGG